jgi:hypothetical protein
LRLNNNNNSSKVCSPQGCLICECRYCVHSRYVTDALGESAQQLVHIDGCPNISVLV